LAGRKESLYNIPMQETFVSYAFGCRVNQAEKEELDRQLISSGFKYDPDNPQIFIINTCAVTKKAEREARQFIYKTRKKFPQAKIIITGCSATKWIKEEVKIKEVDWMIENANKETLCSTLRDISCHSERAKLTDESRNLPVSGIWKIPPRPFDSLRSLKVGRDDPRSDKFLSSGRLLVKIQDGCQRFCTYCIVPYLRGQPRSERIKNIESRIQNYEKEIKEVILAAINTEAYGFDTGEKFIDLIETIIKKTKIPRISLGSVNPWSIDHEFLSFYKKILPKKRLVNFFHVPLQSGSNKILTLMKRGYTREEFMEKLNALAKINPFAAIGTDIIVGFLGETEKDFADTFEFLKDSPIAKFHIFRFSIREKTAAYYMSKKLKEPSVQIKIKRARILAVLGKTKYQKFISKHLGKNFSALFLQRRIENFQEVLLDNQIPAFIKTSKNWMGEIKQIKIDQMKIDKLIGRMV
jgi:threonylcarbamoyladenosine tRNA methylthiotransferase MtaB